MGVYPKAIITSAETLLDYQRDIIERAFKCKVYDQYGCTEQSLFVSQCEKGTYHIHPEHGIVEIINDQGDEVKPGEMGKVVCTSFVNKAMPLIRYDLGDTAIKGDDYCVCGRKFPTIDKIYGRQDDFIHTPDGRKVGRLDPIFKGLSSIKLAQVIQTKLDEITVKLIPGQTYAHTDGQVVQEELQKRVGSQIKINVELVKEIEKTQAGKFRAVISMINKERKHQ